MKDNSGKVMNRLNKVNTARRLRASRTRARFSGTAERPRLSVHISLRHISAQMIDDSKGKTLVSASTVGKKVPAKSMTDRSAWVGAEIAKNSSNVKLKRAVLDRGPKKYHGRIAALADAARKEGLEF